jgi:hypothetical protein
LPCTIPARIKEPVSVTPGTDAGKFVRDAPEIAGKFPVRVVAFKVCVPVTVVPPTTKAII